MKKTIALVAAGVLGLVILAKTTNVSSYVSTAWCQAKQSVKSSVPTKFEIDRIRNEVASLDQDLTQMIRPIAESKVHVDRLRKDIAKSEETLADQKKVLLNATNEVKSGRKEFVYAGKTYSAEQVKTKIAIDFTAYQRLESSVTAQRKLLEAKETSLKAAQEQLVTVMSKKKEYEVRLAELEAKNEINQVAATGTDLKIDGTRAATIEQALRELEDKISADTAQIEMKNGIIAAGNIQLNQPAPDLEAIRAHLQGTADPKTASSK
jgi:chromosome segregation ATPase